MIDISVVIPTHNRSATLARCLCALHLQTLERSRYEIIVVDDGSTDDTASIVAAWPDVLLYRQKRNAGPAAARNVGIRAATGTYILLLGDDTIARPDVLQRHLDAQLQIHRSDVAILGYAPWSQAQPVTPLMRHLFERSTFRQFAYNTIDDPDAVPFSHFYTCNLSIARQFLLQNGLFDEDFRFAYGEDTELGYRLSQRGLRIVFRRDIIVDHEHPTSFRKARQRARVAGEVAVMMGAKHPELVPLDQTRMTPKRRVTTWIKRTMLVPALDPILDLCDRQCWDHPLLMRAYDWSLRNHQWWGVLDALARTHHGPSWAGNTVGEQP